MVREPVAEPPPPGEQWHHKNWHRDGGRHLLTDPLLLWKAQLIFYLSDVDSSTHCFSIAPESVEEKRALAAEPDEDYQRQSGLESRRSPSARAAASISSARRALR